MSCHERDRMEKEKKKEKKFSDPAAKRPGGVDGGERRASMQLQLQLCLCTLIVCT